jgi:hypothetical protein
MRGRATRYGPDSCRPAAAGDLLPIAVSAAANTASSPPPRNSCQYTSQYNAFGCFLHKPIWIGVAPRATYEERLAGYELPSRHWEANWRLPFLHTHLVAWADGLITVESQQEEEGLHLLNCFMAAALLLGLPTAAVSRRDWVPLQVQPGFPFVGYQTALYTPTAVMMEQRRMPTITPVQRYGVLAEADLKRMIQHANTLLTKPGLQELLMLFLYAHTFVNLQEEYTAAFVFGWTIIERYLHNQLQLLQLPQRRREKLAKYSIDAVLEFLEVGGQIPRSQYDVLIHLKKLRNEMVHTAKLIDRKDALSCLAQSKLMLQQLAGIGPGDEVKLLAS